MIKLENVKVCPLHNPNFTIDNKDELIDILPSSPIVINYDYDNRNENERVEQMKIIGMVSSHSDMNIEDGYITSDIYIEEEYKDYCFKNYQCSVDDISREQRIFKIKRLDVIEFEKK